MPKETIWYWVDYMHSKGSTRVEFSSTEQCIEFISSVGARSYRIAEQESGRVIRDTGYEAAREDFCDRFLQLILSRVGSS